jgi:5-methylcytosine-specific restriction endonuclease McrA
VATGLLTEDKVALHPNLVSLFAQLDEIPLSWLDHAFNVSGREAWAIVQEDPISFFWCFDCQALLGPKDPRGLRRLKRELNVARQSRVGDEVSTDLLCGRCTELRLQQRNDECRVARLAQQARAAQLRKMPFDEYRMTLEWQTRRTEALSRAGYRCQVCGERDGRLDVHHNTYDRYGNENICDLVALCGRCHGLFHGKLQDAS